jgi:hypothetical protein
MDSSGEIQSQGTMAGASLENLCGRLEFVLLITWRDMDIQEGHYSAGVSWVHLVGVSFSYYKTRRWNELTGVTIRGVSSTYSSRVGSIARSSTPLSVSTTSRVFFPIKSTCLTLPHGVSAALRGLRGFVMIGTAVSFLLRNTTRSCSRLM